MLQFNRANDTDVDDDAYILSEIHREQALLKRFKRRLPTKIFREILAEMDEHRSLLIGMVSKENVKGKRMPASYYFGRSTPLRHVYNNISSCSYSDTYSGDVYLSVGLGRYVHIYVCG